MTTNSPHPMNFLITGAARGIGRGLSRLLLSRGHRVYLLDHNQPELQHTAATLKHHGSNFGVQLCDLRRPPQLRKAAANASKFFNGHLDCLVNNAANTSTGVGAIKFEDLTLEEWTKSLETNLTAPFLLSQALLPALKNARGCIVHMSSTRARQSEPDSEGYAATKAGLLGLTHSMAASLAGEGVRVNAVLPGWINVANECREGDEKGMTWEEGLSEADHRWHWAGRVGRVEDVLRAVEYLVGTEFVTGQEVVVDGGVSRKMVYPE